MSKFRFQQPFVYIIILTNISILLNIPILRQILGFLFLTILPGLIIMQTLKLNKIDLLDRVVLSWGLGISFLLIFGLLINNFSLVFGYNEPLSTISILFIFDIVYIVLVTYFSSKDEYTFKKYLPNFNLNVYEKILMIISILSPILSIFGMYIMEMTNNNIVILLLIFLISMQVILICYLNNKFSNKLYPVLIFSISISILLLLPLRSNHIIGSDSHMEYYIFQTTLNNLHWDIIENSNLGAILSISLLPTIFQSILKIQPEFLFRILYSLIYSISPLVVYILAKKYVGECYAFLSSCFFMFQHLFLWTEYNARTSIAIFFFGLSAMLIFNDDIEPLKKTFLFAIFMISTIFSHYSTTYIFFFIVLGTFLGTEILSKKLIIKRTIVPNIVILFFVMIFLWYSQLTMTPFNTGLQFIINILGNLTRFFMEESRRQVPILVGKGVLEKGLPHQIEFVFTWLTFLLIGIGIFTLLKRNKYMSFPELNFIMPEFLKKKFDVEYSMMAITCMVLLIIITALPYVSVGYSLNRLFALTSIILAVFYVIGAITLSKCLKIRSQLVILVVLIPYFLSITGTTYYILGYPRSIILDSKGMEYDIFYINDQESYGAKWVSRWQKMVYTDRNGDLRLISQGLVSDKLIDSTSLTNHAKIISYIYIRTDNIVNKRLMSQGEHYYNITNYNITNNNKIYNNGGSEIYE